MASNTLTITIKPEHREGSDFWDIKDCPLSRAIKEEFPDSKVHISHSHVKIGDKYYVLDDKLWNEKVCDSATGDVKVVLSKTTAWALFH